MKVALAYFLVLVLENYIFIAIRFVVGTVMAFIMHAIVVRLLGLTEDSTPGVVVAVPGVAAGLVGTALTIGFAYLVFSWLAGPRSFQAIPLMAALLPLGWTLREDVKHYRLLRRTRREFEETLMQATASDMAVVTGALTGRIAGLAIGAIWAIALGFK